MDKETALVMLGLQRDCLRDSLDPEAWRQLASEYEAIGAESNAAACYKRVDYLARAWYVEESKTVA
jgi:hypothetical protein